jgi:hypothetical protein
VAQAAEVYTQISPEDARALIPELQRMTGSAAKDLPELTREFLRMTDTNFMDRYAFFYKEIAPKIVLYKVAVGDIFPITAVSKAGYSSSVNMKVYGTYRFKSFPSSPIAGNFNIMDMISFRELYGFMTPEKRDETRALEAEMGVADSGRDSVEALFGSPAAAAPATQGKPKQAAKGGNLSNVIKDTLGKGSDRRRIFDVKYDEGALTSGVFLNAAVILKDPSLLKETQKQIDAVSKAKGLEIQTMDWRESAGFMGNMTVMVRGILYVLVLVTFGIAIIMNSMLMATMERTREIGTMRAIGAQKKFLLSLFLQETAILSFIFGAIGTLIGVTIVAVVGTKGIPAMGDPAQGDVSTFFFSGDRLYMSVNPTHIAVVFLCMTLVAIVSTQYPAWRAMKISPLRAIQDHD